MLRSVEYFRGCHFGYMAAVEMLDKYGQAFVRHGAHDLATNLRKRSETHTDFDRGYTQAYSAVARDGRGTILSGTGAVRLAAEGK